MSDVEVPLPDGSGKKESLPAPLVRTLLKQCRASTENYVQKLFVPLFKRLDDDLFKLADKTQEQEKARRYTEAMVKLRSERETLAEKLELTYSRLLSQVLNPDDSGNVDEGPEAALSLIDEAQLEEVLVLDQITSKIFEECSDELYALEQRLALLLPKHKMDEGKIPFGSAPICSAFKALLQPLEFDIKVKLAIYRSLERTLLESISDLFGEMNEHLRQAGILPEIKRTAKKSESSGPTRKKSEATTQHQGGGQGVGMGGEFPAGEGFALPSHAFQGIQQLAGLLGGGESGDSAELIATPVTPQLVEALSGLQISSDLFEQGADISGEELKSRIKAQLSEREGGSSNGLSQLDDETIDVISMIFDDLMDDENLPDFIKALIGRLQIPVLKVAIIDRVFFSEKEHPARQLLNELTIAGQTASIDGGDEQSADLIYKKIESVVMRLIREFQGDLGVFERCLEEFRQFMAEQEAGFHEARKAIGKIAKKSSFEAKTKKNVAAEIAGRLLNRNVPEDVKRFLMETWREVLSTIMLNEGEESVVLQRAEQVSEDLIWSVEPLETPEAKKKLLLVVPLILDALKEGLEMIGYTPAQVQDVNQMIERYHIANIKGGKAPPAAENKPPVVDEIDQLLQDLEEDLDLPPGERVVGDDLSLSAPAGSGSGEFEKMMMEMGYDQNSDEGPRISDKYTVLVDALEEGAWVELTDDKGETRRSKLAWKGDEFCKYAFVNWRYKVVAEKSYFALADEFRQGNASIIEDLPLFDRAFDSVFTRIMKLAG